MAELRVVPEKRRGLGWLWVLLLVLALAAAAYWLWSTGRLGGDRGTRPAATTTSEQPLVPDRTDVVSRTAA